MRFSFFQTKLNREQDNIMDPLIYFPADITGLLLASLPQRSLLAGIRVSQKWGHMILAEAIRRTALFETPMDSKTEARLAQEGHLLLLIRTRTWPPLAKCGTLDILNRSLAAGFKVRQRDLLASNRRGTLDVSCKLLLLIKAPILSSALLAALIGDDHETVKYFMSFVPPNVAVLAICRAACVTGKIDVLREHLPNWGPDEMTFSLVDYAVRDPTGKTLAFLIERGMWWTIGDGPFIEAMLNDHYENFMILRKHYPHISLCGTLIFACRTNREVYVRMILGWESNAISLRECLVVSCSMGFLNIVKILVEHGATSYMRGIHRIIKRNSGRAVHVDIVRFLMSCEPTRQWEGYAEIIDNDWPEMAALFRE